MDTADADDNALCVCAWLTSGTNTYYWSDRDGFGQGPEQFGMGRRVPDIAGLDICFPFLHDVFPLVRPQQSAEGIIPAGNDE